MERLEPVLGDERPDLVLVAGDVNSTLAAALAASKLGIPVAHVERACAASTGRCPRRSTGSSPTRSPSCCFTTRAEAIEQLRAEGSPTERIHFVGNMMIDTLVAVERPHPRGADPPRGSGSSRARMLLVTLHRPGTRRRAAAGRDRRRQLAAIARRACRSSSRSTRGPATMIGRRLDFDRPGILLTEPLGYLDFLSLVAEAGAVLTDSGGIQEETTYLGVPCFTLRDNTERPVTIRAGTNTLLGLDPAAIAGIPAALAAQPAERPAPPPLWDGKASARIAEIVAGLDESQ